MFDHYGDARRAVQDLEAAGVPHRDISIVGHDKDGPAAEAAEDAGKGAGIGAAVGGVGGLLAGLGLLAIPGIGPVVAAGWLAATAAGAAGGAVIGAAAGGLVGALTHAGVPEKDAHVYAEGVRRGGTLVTAKVDEPLVPTARNILSDDRTVNVADRRQAYEAQGWSKFDGAAPAYTDDAIAAERSRYDRV
ncbi:hypothetical protein Q5H94_06305 [Sphingomonas sp. CA1-15]|uniref:General stress protein 17M-like domain-containing protein n=1 Tax=Sphingomonas immobilis TaxID=3063997 RepID=A0ABT8ZWI0_9SPHN|nr:hypothetical protein [Sphingomonas sp. CA1-15]